MADILDVSGTKQDTHPVDTKHQSVIYLQRILGKKERKIRFFLIKIQALQREIHDYKITYIILNSFSFLVPSLTRASSVNKIISSNEIFIDSIRYRFPSLRLCSFKKQERFDQYFPFDAVATDYIPKSSKNGNAVR